MGWGKRMKGKFALTKRPDVGSIPSPCFFFNPSFLFPPSFLTGDFPDLERFKASIQDWDFSKFPKLDLKYGNGEHIEFNLQEFKFNLTVKDLL